MRGARSDAYLEVRERRATMQVAGIHPPGGESRKWPISSLLLLDVPFRYACVVAPRNRPISEILKLILVRNLGSKVTKPNLPKSLRKFLRKEKARIRREVLDSREAEKKIEELIANTMEKYGEERSRQ